MARASAVLTVAESKRLIAKGVAALPSVKRAMHKGMIAIAKGTTNAYVVEELLGKGIDKPAYTTGLTLPKKTMHTSGLREQRLPDVVLKDGVQVEGLTVIEAVKQMRSGDVFIKGANALDYKRRVAGILIGHPEGGTIGATIGTVVARRVELVIPVGLEKLVYEDIETLSIKTRACDDELLTETPTMMPVTGTIVTEIEALKLLCNVDATLISAGGIGGAEGSVRLLIEGRKEDVEMALSLIESIQGEPPFVSS
ncbi:MAG: hypothetical protein RMK18_04995 [Armatimonadota bacterium]|nr:hypothetical protein [Armatimonadota bacterium]MCX7776648.1 hypothetical protein [Armatimonadota bacterium]MDW8025208.1 hypothetical protein [Armatimonadota bacterium]